MKTFKRLLAGCMMASLLFAVSCETVVEQIVENPYDDNIDAAKIKRVSF